ncbi:MAG: hypothetical protein HOD64_00185 [Candidatus Cloacimonetes bacterium]|nr:hypothetical protein [Candidatus Cloacimonadota bacterium]
MLSLEKIGFNTKKYSPKVRVLTNLGYLSVALGLTLLVAGGIKIIISYS